MRKWQDTPPRPRQPWGVTIAALAAICAGAWAQPATAASLVMRSGQTFIGSASFGDAGITVDGHTASLRQIACFQNTAHIPLIMPRGIVLKNGSILRGVVTSKTPAGFIFKSDVFGALTIPAKRVQAIIYSPMATVRLRRLAHVRPCAILINGSRLPGALAWLNRRAIGYRYAAGIVRIAQNRLRCLVLQAPVPPAAGLKRIFIRLKNGDIWATPTAAFTAHDVIAGDRHIPFGAVSALWTAGPGCTPLTTLHRLKTGAGAGKPRAATAPAPIYINRLRRGFLVAQGLNRYQYFETGVGCRPGAMLRYNIGAAYTTLVVAVAVHGRSSATIQVSGDGKMLLRRVVKSGPPHWIHVPVSGIKLLQLQTLPGAAALVTPRVVWGDPFLLK